MCFVKITQTKTRVCDVMRGTMKTISDEEQFSNIRI